MSISSRRCVFKKNGKLRIKVLIFHLSRNRIRWVFLQYFADMSSLAKLRNSLFRDTIEIYPVLDCYSKTGRKYSSSNALPFSSESFSSESSLDFSGSLVVVESSDLVPLPPADPAESLPFLSTSFPPLSSSLAWWGIF
jgi:hypothetical protein